MEGSLGASAGLADSDRRRTGPSTVGDPAVRDRRAAQANGWKGGARMGIPAALRASRWWPTSQRVPAAATALPW